MHRSEIAIAVILSWVSAQGALSVRDFGAAGDGVTDDTAAIQRAAEALVGGDQPVDGHCETRFNPEMIDRPFPALVFPAGTYRVSGPVVFNWDAMLLGEPGAKIVNVGRDKETFYFRDANRLIVEGLVFEGGAVHLRQWTRNRDISSLHVSDCVFRGATRTAVVSDSFKLYRGQPEPGPQKSCEPVDLVREADGPYVLVPRDERQMTPYNNSTLIVIERCRFEGNRTAFRGYSDGVALRSCVFRAPVGVNAPQIRAGTRGTLGVEMYFRDLTFDFPGATVPGRAAIAFDGGRLHIESSSIRADGDLAAVRSISRAGEYYSISQLDLRDVTLDTGTGPVVSLEGPWFPNRLSVAGLRTSQTAKRRVFAFDVEPDESVVRALPLVGERMRCIPPEHCLAFIVEDVDEAHFDCRLPSALTPYRRTPDPSVRRPYGHRSGAEFARDLPKGEVFRDETMGALRRDREPDDTEKLAALVAKAAAAGGGVIELPAKWIGVSRGFEIPPNTLVTCRGRAVLDLKNDDAAVFVVPDGADAAFERVMFVGGGCALASRAEKGRIRALDCAFYGQKGPSVRVESKVPAGFEVEMTGGQAFTPFLYRGNAKFTLDAFWYEESAAAKREETPKSYAAIVNLPGGEMRLRELLGVPVFFQFFGKRYVSDKANHDALRGDYRWVDNHGDFISYHSRYGGEFGGLTALYHYDAARTYLYGGIDEGGEGEFRNGGPAPVVADSPDADVTLVDLVTGIHYRPLQVIWRKDGKSSPVRSARISNCYPYGD